MAAIDGKDILLASAIVLASTTATYNNYTIQFQQLNQNQNKLQKSTSTRCLKKDSHTHFKAPVVEALHKKKYNRCEHQRRYKKKVVIGQVDQVRIGEFLSRHPIELSEIKSD